MFSPARRARMRKAALKLGVAFTAGIACAIYMAKLPSGPAGEQDWAASQRPAVSATANAPAPADAARKDASVRSADAKPQSPPAQKSAAAPPQPAPQPKVAAQPVQPAPAPEPKIAAQSPAAVAPAPVAAQPPQPAQPEPPKAVEQPAPKPAPVEQAAVTAPPPAATRPAAVTQAPTPARAETNGTARREPDGSPEQKVISASREAKAEPAAAPSSASAAEPAREAGANANNADAKAAVADTPPRARVTRGERNAAERKSADRRTREARDGDSEKSKAKRTAQRSAPSAPRSLQADNEADGFNLVHAYRLQDGRRVTVYRRYDEDTTAMAYERRPHLFFSLPGFNADY
jgi:hypothetical protein